MIGRLLGILGALLIAGWLYWLTARVQLLLNHAEEALAKADRLLAASGASAAADATAALPAPSPDAAPEPNFVVEPVTGPPTAPQGLVIEAQKRALVERAFSVDGEPHTFTFRTIRR